MANSDIASSLISYLASNPNLISQFVNHPYSTTQQVAGSNEQLSQEDMSEIVTAAAALSTGKNVDLSNLSEVAATLLSQNGNSVHTLTSSLFGGSAQTQAPSTPAPSTTQASSGLDLGTLINLAGALSGSSAASSTASSSAAKKKKTGFDLSDGFDSNDVIGLASLFLSGK